MFPESISTRIARYLHERWRRCIEALAYFSAMHPLLLVFYVFLCICLLIVVITVRFFPNDSYSDREFIKGILGNIHGSLFDMLVIGIFVLWLNRLGERKQTINRYLDEIEDYSMWTSEEATHRIVSNIRRLNREGITKISLSNTYLREANLMGVNLAGADLTGADLIGANLAGAKLDGAKLVRAKLAGANLNEVRLSGADLNEADLYKAELTEIYYGSTTRWPLNFEPPKSVSWLMTRRLGEKYGRTNRNHSP